jgi:hypothetical protein
MAQVATQVRHRVTRLGTTRVSNSDKKSGTILDKGPGKNSGKEARQHKLRKIGRFLCFGLNPS